MSLLIVGGTGVDLILPRVARLPSWPAHLEFTAANLVLLKTPPLVTIGGNGGNAAYVAAHCGAEVKLSTNLGDDAFGELVSGWLGRVGCVVVAAAKGGRTALNVTAADQGLRRATFFYPGVAPRLPPIRLTNRPAGWALICGWPHPSASAAAARFKAWRRQGWRTAYDIGPFLGETRSLKEMKPMLAELDIFIANEHEVMTVARTRSLKPALSRLRDHFTGHMIIKLGRRGVMWVAPASLTSFHVPALRVKAVNTVGAGDSFNGAFLAALDRGDEFPAALRFANRLAAQVVRSGRGVLGLKSS